MSKQATAWEKKTDRNPTRKSTKYMHLLHETSNICQWACMGWLFCTVRHLTKSSSWNLFLDLDLILVYVCGVQSYSDYIQTARLDQISVLILCEGHQVKGRRQWSKRTIKWRQIHQAWWRRPLRSLEVNFGNHVRNHQMYEWCGWNGIYTVGEKILSWHYEQIGDSRMWFRL